jgi:hypothetical protein
MREGNLREARSPLEDLERMRRPLPTWPYPLSTVEDEIRKVLKEILARLDSVEARLERIEKLLTSKSGTM